LFSIEQVSSKNRVLNCYFRSEALPRTDFSLGAHTRKLHKTAREIVSPEQYIEVIEDLLRQAFLRDDERTALAAKKLIIEYIEGKPKETINVTGSSQSIADVLGALRQTTQQESAQRATEDARESETE
jgi:hypothetical protein